MAPSQAKGIPAAAILGVGVLGVLVGIAAGLYLAYVVLEPQPNDEVHP